MNGAESICIYNEPDTQQRKVTKTERANKRCSVRPGAVAVSDETVAQQLVVQAQNVGVALQEHQDGAIARELQASHEVSVHR